MKEVRVRNPIVKHVKEVTLTIDMSTFGKIQKNKFRRFLSTGIVIGGGAPAILAKEMLEAQNLAIVIINYWSIKWANCHSDSFIEALDNLLTLKMLDEGTDGKVFWKDPGALTYKQLVDNRPSNGVMYISHIDKLWVCTTSVTNGVSVGQQEHEQLAKQIDQGEIYAKTKV